MGKSLHSLSDVASPDGESITEVLLLPPELAMMARERLVYLAR